MICITYTSSQVISLEYIVELVEALGGHYHPSDIQGVEVEYLDVLVTMTDKEVYRLQDVLADIPTHNARPQAELRRG